MVTKELEKLCLSSKFNQLGALQFDKSLRSIVTYFSSVISAGNSIDSAAFGAPTSAIRDKFIRLNQISSLLNSEQVRDVQDLWPTDGGLGAGIKWRLGQAEVRKILVLRVDFGQSEVNALKL